MDKKYADFDKLNRLLVASFEAEKLYYNAAEDAKNTELKRFLNYMAVERNRMSHDISNELHSRDIEPLKEDAEKGSGNRTWKEIKEALEVFDVNSVVNSCIARDRNNIKRYTELIEAHSLPEDILDMLYNQRKQLEWYIKQAEQHRKDPFLPEPSTRDEALKGTSSKKKPSEESSDDSDSKKKDEGDDDDRIIRMKAI
jgi:uncharacterized protein (TIGR02284 family)